MTKDELREGAQGIINGGTVWREDIIELAINPHRPGVTLHHNPEAVNRMTTNMRDHIAGILVMHSMDYSTSEKWSPDDDYKYADFIIPLFQAHAREAQVEVLESIKESSECVKEEGFEGPDFVMVEIIDRKIAALQGRGEERE